jgi:SSS family solute:Na+ symporter
VLDAAGDISNFSAGSATGDRWTRAADAVAALYSRTVMDPYILLDVVVFFGFIIAVIAVGIGMSRGENDSEDYFLAGRGLSWWLIGFSLIAANISTEQFIGMSGQAASYVGLAIASYEWMAAVTLVFVAFFFLPKFLSAGIYTIPEFLEYRFNHSARMLMSLLMMIIYVGVTLAAVIYSGALTAEVIFGGHPLWGGFEVTLTNASWIIGILAAVYVVAGGLKACAWADLIQGSALILGGAIVSFLAFQALGKADPAAIGLAAEHAGSGAIERFHELNGSKLHMVLPATDTILPWTALALGLWIPNLYYWGLNQYITQRTLGAHSLAAGQRGVVFAAAMKLIIPFIIVIPGMIAFNLFAPEMKEQAGAANQRVLDKLTAGQSDPQASKIAFDFDADFALLQTDVAGQIVTFNQAVAGMEATPPAEPGDLVAQNAAALAVIKAKNAGQPAEQQVAVETRLIGYKYDSAFAMLLKQLVHPGIRGFVLAALLGAVVSSLAAMLNASSTIFTMDLYKQYLNPGASQTNLVAVGRLCVVIFTAIGCWIAPQLGNPKFEGIFTYIQEFQGFISPGVLAVFLFGLFVHRAPRACGVVGLLICPIVYGALKLTMPDMAFLNRMALTFGAALAALAMMTIAMPLKEPVALPQQTKIELVGSPGAKFWGAVVVIATLALYAIFF